MNEQIYENVTTDFVFKVLSGSLNGIEFSLTPHNYFICVGDASAQQGNLAFSERTLYIPTAEPRNNFIVNLENPIEDNTIAVSVCFPDRQETQRLELNTICEVEGVHFAIKQEGQEWSDVVQQGVLPLPAIHLQADNLAMVPEAKRSNSLKRYGMALLVLALLAVVGVGGRFGWKYMSEQAEAVSSSTKLHDVVGDRAGYSVHVGKNEVCYLFASNLQQAEWAQQALQRKHLSETWRVVTPQSEEARLAGLLERNNIAFFAIRFVDPGNPTLLLSKTRNATDEASLSHVTQLLIGAMPYAHSIHILLHDDAEVLNKAQQGLKALGFDYQTVQSESGVTLMSGLPSVDVHLSEFSRFVAQFYQTWGRRYVHFSADIRDDLLQDKSYKYGDDGYITMSKSHWMFNKKME